MSASAYTHSSSNSSARKRSALRNGVAWVRNVLWHLRVIYAGMKHLKQTGTNLPEVRQHMISLFCRTWGWGNEAVHQVIRRSFPPVPQTTQRGILGDLDSAELDKIVKGLSADGYYVFPQTIPQQIFDGLLSIPPHLKATPDGTGEPIPVFYDRNKVSAARYFYAEKDLLNFSAIQKIISDPSLIAVAQSYLKCAPIIDIVSLGWSTNFETEKRAEAAQMYHFDFDRLRWLKFFIYLTDVGPQNGPHCYIRKSHKPFGIPYELLKRNYSRLYDHELSKYYSPTDFIELTAPKGTIIAVDTRGLHKGKPLQSGERLMFGMEFCDHLVGAEFTYTPVTKETAQALAQTSKQFPRLYSKFNFAA